jgi:hypothetical protein
MTEEKLLRKIALWLEIIADELYVARTDREMEEVSGSEPEMWNSQGRDYMIRGIENAREIAEKD